MNILEAKNITKKYVEHLALDNVSISIPKGSIFGLLGPNGAGKTTFIRIVTQIIMRDSGDVFFDGESLAPKHSAQIGYLPEERGLYRKMKVGEQLLYLAQLKGMEKQAVKTQLRYWGEKFGISGWWDKKIQDLSKGMQQKVQFISTVIHRPQLIILDEPFSGFDPVNANLIKDEILHLQKEGHSIIFSTHRMESVEELCEEIVLINRSKIVLEGSKKQIKDTYKDDTFILKLSEQLDSGEYAEQGFELLESPKSLEDNCHEHTIRLKDASLNQVLHILIGKGVQISEVVEKVPSINEIFIRTVQGH